MMKSPFSLAGNGGPAARGGLALLLAGALALPALAAGDALRPQALRPWSLLDGGPSAASWAADDAGGPLWGPDLGAFELLEAALLPGLNQARHGQWWKTVVFVGVEAGVLALSSKLNSEGDDLDAEFKAWSHEHWNYERYVGYRQAPGEYALEEGWYDLQAAWSDLGMSGDLAEATSQQIVDALFAAGYGAEGMGGESYFHADGGRGSHVLPGNYTDGYSIGEYDAWNHFSVNRTQQYYEMIGKYAQFQRGWDDYGTYRGFEFAAQAPWGVTTFSANSQRYMDIRTESNDKLIAADRIVGLLLVNHAASFVDALLRRNKGRTSDWRADGAVLHSSTGPVPGLRLSWSFR